MISTPRKLARLGGGSAIGLIAALALFGRASTGCSASSTGGSGEFGGSDSAGTSTQSNGNGGNGAGNGTGGGSGGNTGSFVTSTTATGTIDPDAACFTGGSEATLIPLNMFIMFDKSGSMQSANKWNDATAAIVGFFQDPTTAGLRVALRFFPFGGCSAPSCSADSCALPLVPLGALSADPAPADAQEDALVQAVGQQTPDGSHTPIFPALSGAEQWAIDHQTQNPTEKTIVILVTDGIPEGGCNNDEAAIVSVAASAFASGILTYSIGLQGSSVTLMENIATAGGTSPAIFIGTGSNATQELIDALKAIQGSEVSCEFLMPPLDNEGNPIDPKLVNVVYKPGDGSPEVLLGQVPNAGACTAAGGWYYDNNQNPTKVTLCPATCAIVQGDDNAKIDVRFGCATKPQG